MTKSKNNVYFLFLALALAFILMPVLTQSVSAAEQTKILHIRVVDDETGKKVWGSCEYNTGTSDGSVKTNAGGEAKVTLDKDATVAHVACYTRVGYGSTNVNLKENGTTHVTVRVSPENL